MISIRWMTKRMYGWKPKPLRIGFGALSPRVLVLPFSHSFPSLRFSLSLHHRTSQEKESKGEGPESQALHQQQDGYQRHACTRSAHRFSCLCESHLILKPKIRHNVALLAIHNLTIHTFWSHLQMHVSHFDSAGIVWAHMLLHEECVSYPHWYLEPSGLEVCTVGCIVVTSVSEFSRA